MATSSKLTWQRLFEAADRLDNRVCTKEHEDAVFMLLLKCAVASTRAKHAGEARARRLDVADERLAAPLTIDPETVDLRPRAARVSAGASTRPRRVFFKSSVPIVFTRKVDPKNMTDAEVLALARRLARL